MSAIPKVQLKANSQLVNFNVNTKLNSAIKNINGVDTEVFGDPSMIAERFPNLPEASLPDFGIPDPTADLPVIPSLPGDLIPDSIKNSTADKLKLAKLSTTNASAKIGGLFTSFAGLDTRKISELASLGELEVKINNAKILLGDVPATSEPKTTAKSDKPAKSLQLQAGGGIVNFNVNKKLPYKDVMYDYMSEGLKLYRIYGVQAQLDAEFPTGAA
jgi:hypothetical protein|tara:strand:- start:3483 stop:4130 length:648 start_codon:yes stop_codon:yes gene_type:complete